MLYLNISCGMRGNVHHKIILPKLPFGDSLVHVSHDIKLFSQNLSKVVTSLQYYDIQGEDKIFGSKSYVFQTKGFKAIASANTPINIMVNDSNDITLLIPFSGENVSTVENSVLQWKAGAHAILLPQTARGGYSTLRSTLTVDINPSKLHETARSMLGIDPYTTIDFRLNEPRVIPLHYGTVSFMEPIRNLCGLIDSYQCDNDMLSYLNLDDLFYRLIVTLLMPELFFKFDIASNQTNNASTLDHLIEYADSHPEFFNTLSDLESFTGLSTRVLQYSFSKTLQITPKQWLRQLKMNQAHAMIMAGQENINITRVAMECGFTHFSLFSKYYRTQFGELPSETLRKIK